MELLGERLTPASMREKYILKQGDFVLQRGKYRKYWLELMATRAKRGDFSIMFARWRTLGHEAGDQFNAGERYIQVIQDGELTPTHDVSRDLRELLDTVVQWSRQVTVDVIGAAQRSKA